MPSDPEFDDLYLQTAGDLFDRALALTGNPTDADDLVQGTFLAAWSQWPKIRTCGLDRQRAWLWTVAKNKAVSDFRRRHLTRPVDPVDIARAMESESSCRDLESDLVAKDLLDRCWGVIQKMPRTRRLVMVLHAYGDSTNDIATMLGIQPSTVRGHRMHAIRELSTIVAPDIKLFDAGGEEGS